MKYTNIVISALLICLMSGVSIAAVPDAPENMTNTTGNSWVRWAWDVGTGDGNITDSYNVSTAYGGTTTWINGSTNAYKRLSSVGGESVTICAYGYNVTYMELSVVTTDTVIVPQMFNSIVTLIDAIVPIFSSLLNLIVAIFPLVIALAFLGGLAMLISKIFGSTLDLGKMSRKR